jgi:hypothetical protein
MPRKYHAQTPLDERLWGRVVPGPNGCVIWTGWLNNQGYGTIQYQASPWYVHRLAYTLMVGPIPEGLSLDHLCRNTRCLNHYHLEPVPQKINAQRGLVKDVCKRGHDLTRPGARRPDRPDGHMGGCAECDRLRYHERKA